MISAWEVLGWLLVFLVAVIVFTITVAMIRSLFKKPEPPKTHHIIGGDK